MYIKNRGMFKLHRYKIKKFYTHSYDRASRFPMFTYVIT